MTSMKSICTAKTSAVLFIFLFGQAALASQNVAEFHTLRTYMCGISPNDSSFDCLYVRYNLVPSESCSDQKFARRVTIGEDLNHNAMLDKSELIYDHTDCVEPIKNTTLTWIRPSTSNFCSYGGWKTETSYDLNEDSRFDENEVFDTTYLCNPN